MMKMHLKTFLSSTLLILIFYAGTAERVIAQSELSFENSGPPDLETIISVRERFEYKVTYSFFTVGWVEVELLPDTTYNGKKAHHLRTIIESNNKIPFVKKNLSHYENLFFKDDENVFSYLFWRDDIHENQQKAQKVVFDREKDEVRFYEDGEPQDTLDLKEPASGGDIIFIISRMFAGTEKELKLPVYIENKLGYVTAENSTETEMRKYEAFDEPVKAYKGEGQADIDGPFGFTGEFKSWFATDDRRIPLEAHVKVLFGNVKIKLTNYEVIDE